MKRTLVAVYTCAKYLDSRVAAVRDTWLKAPLPPGVEVRIFLGAGVGPPRDDGLLTYLPCPDGYESLPRKTWCLFKEALSRFEFDQLLKIDDDVFVPDPARLLAALSGRDYAGYRKVETRRQTWHYDKTAPEHRVPVPDDHFPRAYMNGHLYLVSRRTLEDVTAIDEREIPHLAAPVSHEDIMVGWLVERCAARAAYDVAHEPRILSAIGKSTLEVLARLPESLAAAHLTPAQVRLCHVLVSRWPLLLRGLGSGLAVARVLRRSLAPRDAAAHAALAAHETATEAPAAPGVETAFVSVIVPLYNEAPRIAGLLDALLAQDYPADRYEVLLVDNGSSDETLALCRNRRDTRVVVLEERAMQGPDAARNKALPVARGSILAFTDGDCRPAPDWLAAGVAALASADLAGGEVRATTAEPPSLSELYDALTFLRHADSIARRGTAFTANLFVRRTVFDELGPFPVLAGWNGDAAFSARATSRGFKLVYAPAALVEHPARGYAELAAKVRRIGRGQGLAGAPPAGRPSHCGSPLRLGRWLAKPHVAHLSPLRLRRAVRAREGTLSLARGVLLWLLGVRLLVIGLAAFAAGRSEKLASRLRPLRLRKLRV